MIATARDRSTGEITTSRAAVKRDDGRLQKVRVEMAEGGVLMDHEAGAMYAWISGAKVATKLDISDAGAHLDQFCMALAPGAEVVGRETIVGINCWVVRTVDDDGREATLWVSRESGLTQRMETEETVVDYAYTPPHSTHHEFELPEGLQVREAPIE